MSVLFFGHPGEQFRRGTEIRAERFGKVAIDARVFFLGGDGEGQYLRFVQVAKVHALNFRNDNRAGDNKASANPVSPGQGAHLNFWKGGWRRAGITDASADYAKRSLNTRQYPGRFG